MDAFLRIDHIFLSTTLYVVWFAITGFFAIHAMQYVADPFDRTLWLLFIIPFPLLGAGIYFFTKYQEFKNIGKGHLICQGTWRGWKTFTSISESEKKPHHHTLDLDA